MGVSLTDTAWAGCQGVWRWPHPGALLVCVLLNLLFHPFGGAWPMHTVGMACFRVTGSLTVAHDTKAQTWMSALRKNEQAQEGMR